MTNEFLRWISFNSGWALTPSIDNEKCSIFEMVEAPNGQKVLLSEIVKHDFYFSSLMQAALEQIQETIFSSEEMDRKIYCILFNYDHKSRKWNGSVFLNGKEIAVTASKDSIFNIKLIVLKFIYQLETGE